MVDIVRFVTDLLGETEMTKSDFDLSKMEAFQKATVKDVMSMLNSLSTC
jgi:hypothetical protein